MESPPAAQGLTLEAVLAAAVEQWDPLHAAEPGLAEYAELVPLLRNALLAGLGRAELSRALWDHLEDIWGVQPWRCGVDRFVDRLVTWREAWPADRNPG
jgi:hypothetical protein